MHCVQGIPSTGMGVENWDREILLNTKLDNTFGDSSLFPNENARMKVVPSTTYIGLIKYTNLIAFE
jgi:hypothetical protein